MRGNLAFLIVTFLFAAQLLAHDTWIVPDRFTIREGGTIELHMTSGMAFPKLDTAIKPDRIARSILRFRGQSSTVAAYAGDHSLDIRIPIREAGTATIAIELKPKLIELTPTQVLEYLDEIGADAQLRQAWAERPEPKRWREIYTKHAKSFVLVGRPDESWKEPAGLGFEFVPLADPTSLKAGTALRVRLIEDGKPLTNFSIGAVHESDLKGTVLQTDAEGEVTIPLVKKGRYLLRATHLRPAQRPDADWISAFTTLTLDVK